LLLGLWKVYRSNDDRERVEDENEEEKLRVEK